MFNKKLLLRVVRILLAYSVFVFPSAPAFAWDGIKTNKISYIEVTSGGNFGFRVYLTDVPTMCTGGPSWAYINEADSNYKTYVAALLLARAQGSSVTVNSNLDGGNCHIGHIVINPV